MTRPSTMSSVDASKPPKRSTRSTIRSLGLASVGKALADVMSKEAKELEGKKSFSALSSSRDSSASQRKRITSSTLPKLNKDVGSTNDQRQRSTTPGGPEANFAARSKASTTSLHPAGKPSVDDARSKRVTPSPQGEVQTKSKMGTFRSHKPLTDSSLPKYRPRSAVLDAPAKKPPSPIRVDMRRKRSGSGDDKGSSRACTPLSSSTQSSRGRQQPVKPAGPVLKRSVKDEKISSSGDEKPSRLSSDSQESSKSSTQLSSHPKKTREPSSSPVVTKIILPRLSSESPRTPKGSPRTPTFAKNVPARTNTSPVGRESPSPLRALASANDSPPHNNSRKNAARLGDSSNENTPTAMSGRSPIVNVGDVSCDSQEADDVEFMLAEVASPSGSTPVLPRHGFTLYPPSPESPSRTSHPQVSSLDLNLSPTSFPDGAPTISLSTRVSPGRRPSALRSSIAAWEALADLSTEINASELGGGLITEVDLPFTPSILSPSPSIMRLDSEREGLECPTPYSLPSPGGFASISQMLLPGSTPSPAPALRTLHSSGYLSRSMSGSDSLPVDSAAATLLKLQLASAEILAKERLSQLIKLEDDLNVLNESKKHDDREHAAQIQDLESRLGEALALSDEDFDRDRTAGHKEQSGNPETHESSFDPKEHANCYHALEEHMRLAENEKKQAVSAALAEHAERERAERARTLARAAKRQQLALAARDAHQAWIGVHSFASTELDSIYTNRQTLEVLRAGLDFFEAQILISRYVRIPPPSAVHFPVE